jgi:hypothetical protein
VNTSDLAGGPADADAGLLTAIGETRDACSAPAESGSADTIAIDHTNILSADAVDTASTVAASTVGVSAGATIFVAIKWQSDAATVASVVGGGLTWTVDSQSGAKPGIALARAFAPSGLTPGTTITVTFSAQVYKRVVTGVSFFGIDPSNPLDTVADAASGSGTSYASSVVAASGANELIVTALEMFTSDGTWSPTAPTLMAADISASSSHDDVSINYLTASSPGPYSTLGSWQGTGNVWVAVSASYRRGPQTQGSDSGPCR